VASEEAASAPGAPAGYRAASGSATEPVDRRVRLTFAGRAAAGGTADADRRSSRQLARQPGRAEPPGRASRPEPPTKEGAQTIIGHPDADTLAACREGLLGTRRSARIRKHLARCSRCASLDHELAAVSTLLASTPAPKIPDELAARLDAVLAAESAARARGESPATDGIPATVGARVGPADGQAAPADGQAAPADGEAAPGSKAGPRPDQPRSARPPRPWRVTALRAASVTAVLLIIAVGGYGLSRLLHTSGGVASSSAPAGSGGSPGFHNGAAAPGGSSGSGTGSPRAGLMLPGAGVPVVQSGTDYQPDQLVAQAEKVLPRHPAKAGGQTPASVPSFTMRGCVKLFAGGAPPTLVDEATYGGQLATIIIRAPAGGHPGRVWVIVPRCSAASPRLIATAVLPASG
jgi:hypothetical protein